MKVAKPRQRSSSISGDPIIWSTIKGQKVRKPADSDANERWIFLDLIKYFTATTVIMYFYTVGYVSELGIPESPDLQKSTYFFITAFFTTAASFMWAFFSTQNSIYFYIYQNWPSFVGISVACAFPFLWVQARKRLVMAFAYSISVLKRNWVLILMILPLAFLQVMKRQFFFLTWYMPLDTLVMETVDPKFFFFFFGMVACVLIPLGAHHFVVKWNIKYPALVLALLVGYSSMICFHLSREGMRFMFFPIGTISRLGAYSRFPFLWTTERGRYVALCGDYSWRLLGVANDGKDYYIGDTRTSDWSSVCRHLTRFSH